MISPEMVVARAERAASVRQQPRPQADSAEAATRQQNPGSTDSVETSAAITQAAKNTAVNPSGAETAEAAKISLPPPESVFLVELQIYENSGQGIEIENSGVPRLDIRI